MPGLGDTQRLSFGSLNGPCVMEYFRDDTLVGVVGIDSVPQLVPYRNLLMKRG